VLNGCVVVSEHSRDFEPLEPGTHLVLGRPETLGLLAVALLEDRERLRRLRAEALGFCREHLPLRTAALALATAAADAAARPVGARLPHRRLRRPRRPGPDLSAGNPLRTDPDILIHRPETDTEVVRRALKDVRLEVIELRRALARDRLERLAGRELARAEVAAASAGYAAARPRVSVLVTLYDYGEWIGRALTSVVENRYRDVELVIVDDGSTDDSLERARAWVADHRYVPALLVRHRVNGGLPHARNTALGLARGELSFILDADNELYPHALERLVAALDARDDAAFAYGMLQNFYADVVGGLRNTRPWEPARFRIANYIDATALFRTDVLRRLGGYTTDRVFYGWEDYELWCRIATSGARGVLVPEIVGRYRLSPNSMLGLTNLSTTAVRAALGERYPELLGEPA
jgi:hypothetical protein